MDREDYVKTTIQSVFPITRFSEHPLRYRNGINYEIMPPFDGSIWRPVVNQSIVADYGEHLDDDMFIRYVEAVIALIGLTLEKCPPRGGTDGVRLWAYDQLLKKFPESFKILCAVWDESWFGLQA